MLSTQSLREQLNRYADGEISANALEEWLAAESWDMARWAPIGLQRLVENVQAAFITYSDGGMELDGLDRILRQRQEQLNRAGEVTKRLVKSKPILLDIQLDSGPEVSVAASEALLVTAVAEPAVA